MKPKRLTRKKGFRVINVRRRSQEGDAGVNATRRLLVAGSLLFIPEGERHERERK